MRDLIGGRAAWTVLGLPTDGQIGDRRRVAQYVIDAPSIGIDATVGDAREVAVDGRPIAVVNAEAVLLGALQPTAVQLPADAKVEDVMVSAPGTMRPDVRVDDAVRRLEGDGLDHIFVTTVGGQLMGLLELDSLHV